MRRGVTGAVLKTSGKTPEDREELTRAVREGRKVSRHSTSRMTMMMVVVAVVAMMISDVFQCGARFKRSEINIGYDMFFMLNW